MPTLKTSKEMGEAIEKCISIRGNKAYDGSYAAPREAFRDVLKNYAISQRLEDMKVLLEKMEGMKSSCPHNHRKCNTSMPCVITRVSNKILSDLKSFIGSMEK